MDSTEFYEDTDDSHLHTKDVSTQHSARLLQPLTNPQYSFTKKDNLTLKIDYIKSIYKIKRDLELVKRFQYTVVAIILALVIGFFIIQVWLNLTYKHDVIKTLENENDVIFEQLRSLYKECKDNPMNFDWAAVMSTKIDDSNDEIKKIILNELYTRFDKMQRLINRRFNIRSTRRTNTKMKEGMSDSILLKIKKGENIVFSINGVKYEIEADEDYEGEVDHTEEHLPTVSNPDDPWVRPGGPPGIKVD